MAVEIVLASTDNVLAYLHEGQVAGSISLRKEKEKKGSLCKRFTSLITVTEIKHYAASYSTLC